MRPAARYIAAGVVAVALGAAPGFAQAQSTDPSSTSTPPASSQETPSGSPTQGTQAPSSTQPQQSSTSPDASSGGVDEAAAREHLSQARQALAELTKLPAAAQLQGDQRTAISNLIQAFNGLATATNDWRPKFKAVTEQLDQILGSDGSGTTGTAGATAGTPSSTGAPPSDSSAPGATTGAAGASAGSYDPEILAKLREVKTHLDGFQEASGDPTPHFDAIDGIVDAALSGSAGTSVGTTGSTASSAGTSGDAGGTVTIGRAQLEEIKQHVAKLRAATEAAARRQ
jgi:hypothetical protein